MRRFALYTSGEPYRPIHYGTHAHDGVTDRYATRSPVEAPLTRSHIAHDKPYARTYVRTLEPR